LFRSRHHRAAFLAVIATTIFSVSGPVAIAGKKSVPGTEIRDLYYGEVLFHFFQDDEFTALTHMLAAQQFGRVTNHAAEAKLLVGGLYLSYGQHRQAGEIFDRLLDGTSDPAVRSRVWFFLGKVRYQRGLFSEAEEAFGHVEQKLPDFLDAEYHMLLAQSLMGQGKFSDAAEVLNSWERSDGWLAYSRFNLGVAFVRTNQLEEGAGLLDQVGQIKTDEPEMLALRDKANLALGYAYLQAEQGEAAKEVLERVRLRGPFSSKALLGVGWADSLREDYRGALNPWLELQDRDLLDSAVQESLLAVPYAFGQLKANGSAAEYYLSALNQFDTEILRLDAALDRADSGDLIPALLRQDESGTGRWHWQLEALPKTEDARYLYHLVANHDFQHGLRNYRDLVALYDHLEEWRGKLSAFDNMVDTGAQAYAERLPVVESRMAEIDIAAMRAQRDSIAADLSRIEKSWDILGFATDAERRQWFELETMESGVAWNSENAAAARDKQRVLKGVLQWNLEAEYKYRLWRQRRSLAELDSALTQAEQYRHSVDTARATVPARLEEFAARIELLAPRIEVMQAGISAALGDQETELQILAARELEAQKERLSTYRLQARFALAAIYDHGTVAAADNAGVDQ
jgi:tetratricopeptide (TPR) repeat protein